MSDLNISQLLPNKEQHVQKTNMSVHPFCSCSHFRAVCTLILPVSAPPPPPLAQRVQEDVHPLVATSHSPPPFRVYQGGQRDNPHPPSPPSLRPHCSRPSPSCSEGGGGWESPPPGYPRPARVPLPLAQGGLPRSPPPPPLSLQFMPPPCLPPSFRANEARGMESSHPPTPPIPCPVPCAPPPFACENRMQRGGTQGEGPGPSGGPTSTASGGGNTVTDMAAGQCATQAGAVHVNRRAGVWRRVQGRRRAMTAPPHVHRG